MKTMKTRIMVLAAIFLLASEMVSAQQFQASHIKKAVTKLKLDAEALATDSLPATKQMMVGAQKIVVRKDAKGVVEHIGVPLFAEEMRQLKPSPIYDYLEYTVLDRLYKVNDNTLTLQDLKFEKGNLASLAKVMENADGCSIENVGEKYYRVKWTTGNSPIVIVSFPINYELLANSNRKEMEQNFIRNLKNYIDTMPKSKKNYSEQMAPTKDPNVFVVPGKNYIIDEINDNRYLTITSKESGEGKTHNLEFLFDRNSPKESLANIMVESDMPVEGARITLEFVLGNYKRDTVTVALRDWISFCVKQGCQPFFGFEENVEGTLTGTLIMCNKQSGYDHIIAVKTTESELFADCPLVHGKVHLFTPSANVRNLFGVATKSNRPRIKYAK